MSPGAQESLDRAFGVTPDDRARLRRLEIPRRILGGLRAVHLEYPRWLLPAAMLLFVVFAVTDSAASRTALTFSGAAALNLWIVLRRARWTSSACLRILEGPVRTARSWNYGHGDVYTLWAELEIEPDAGDEAIAPERGSFSVFSKLGDHVLSGRARLFVVRVPSKHGGSSGMYESVLAVEALEETRLVEKRPARPPPDEPNRGGVPAD